MRKKQSYLRDKKMTETGNIRILKKLRQIRPSIVQMGFVGKICVSCKQYLL